MNEINRQLPPDIPVDVVIPQTTVADTVSNKPAFDTRNYLDFSIPKGETSREIWIRLLPVNPETNELFQIIKLHSIPVNKELNPNKSGRKSYLCLKHNSGIDHDVYGSKCPICEEQKKLWDKWHQETDPDKKKEIQKAAGSLDTRDYCIVRCIERGKEADGPKFWRIPLRQDQTDAYHKIVNLIETRKQEGIEAGIENNIVSIYHGRDLKITFTEGTGAPTVVDKSISTPLTKDNDQLTQWYYDDKKWTDVFGTKTYEYLKIAYDGDIPWYDKDAKKWVSKKEVDGARVTQDNVQNIAIAQAEARFTSVQPVYTTEPIITVPKAPTNVVPGPVPTPEMDDDLPF